MMFHDRLRSVALGAACAGFVAVPTLGPVLTGGEQSRRHDTVITPPDYAFTIWAPIFAGCLLSTVQQCRAEGRTDPVSRGTGWPLAGAYATNAAWSVAAQTRFELTPFLLPVATAFTAAAQARLQHLPAVTRTARTTSESTGLLLGWTALASTVNLAAGARLLGVEQTSRRTVWASSVALLGASGLLAGLAASSRNGTQALATSAAWGLLTTATTAHRPLVVRVAAALGALGVVGAGTRSTKRRGRATSVTR